MKLARTMLLLGALAASGLTDCRSSSTDEGTSRAASGGTVKLNAAGSTFVYPLMSKWSSEYQKVAPEVEVNYQSIGSGGGIRQLVARTVQFGATDAPMTDEQVREAKSPVVHIPLVMGAVVPTYNVANLPRAIQFTPETLSAVFLGEITSWGDAAFSVANPGLKLPEVPIVVVHRSDGSGTTYVWADYLSKVSPEWRRKVGTATSVNWPAGLGGKGNEGVAGLVEQTPGAIGYVELTYARQNHMPVGQLRNRAGNFVEPTALSVTAAAASTLSAVPDDLRYSITDASGADAWPISGTTWAVVYADMPASAERQGVMGFLKWAIHDGQKFCASLDYAALPDELVRRADAKLASLAPAGK